MTPADKHRTAASEQTARTDAGTLNTDRELWREREGDYYADSLHITANGGIGINCEGHVFVKPIRTWHLLAGENARLERDLSTANARLERLRELARALIYAKSLEEDEAAHIALRAELGEG